MAFPWRTLRGFGDMRLWVKLLIGALALVLVLIAGAVVFVSQVDPNDYKDTITDAVEGATGRKLVLGGDLRINLLPVPSLEANDVTFANAPWASQPDMLRVNRLRADLALLPLLEGRLEILRFDAIEPEVFLETDAAGKGNWEFADESASVVEIKADSEVPSEELGIAVNEISMEKAGVEFLDGKTGDNIVLDVQKMTVGTKLPDDRLTLVLRATYQELPVTLDGRLGAVGALRRNQPIEVDVQGKVGEADFSVEGVVGKPLEGGDLRLDVGLKSPSTKKITDVAGLEVEEIGPVEMTLRLVEEGGHFHLDPVEASARPRGSDARISGSVKNITLDRLSSSADGAVEGKAVSVDLQGSFAESRLSIVGDVGNLMNASGLRVDIAAETKSTRALTELAGIDVEEVGPLDLKLTLIEKNDRFNLDKIVMTARPRGARVTIKGSVQDVVDSPRPDLDVAVSAKTLRQLDETLPDAGPVSLSAKVRPSGKVIEIRELVAKVGKSDLSGSATVDTGAKPLGAKAKLRAKQIDLKEFAPPADKSDAPTAVEKPAGGKIFSGDPLPLDALKKFNADIELAVGRLITPKLTFDKVNVAARLENGNLTVKPAIQVAGGTVNGIISIDARTQPAKFAMDVEAKKVSIGALTKELRGYETSKGLDSNLTMKLRGQGNSVRALMGRLDGDIRLDIGEGRLNNDVLDRVGADLLTQLIGVAVPTDEEEKTTAFKCAVVRFAIAKGDAIADETLVMETGKVLVKGGGLIDLKAEELDLGASLTPRKGIRIGAGTLSSLARVQGTLANPRLGTDLKGMAKTGARVGIAVATGGLSLLAEGLYDSATEDDQPCQTALTHQIKITPAEYKAPSQPDKN